MTCISPLQIPTGMPGSGSSPSSRPRLPRSSRSQLAKVPINSSLPSTAAGTANTSSQPGRSPIDVTQPLPNPGGNSNADLTELRSVLSPHGSSSHMPNHQHWQSSSYFPPAGYVDSSTTGNLPPPEILAGGGVASPNAAALSPPVSDTQLSLSAGNNKPSFLDPSTAPTYCRNGVPSYVPAPQPLPRSISADAATTASSAQVIRRLSQQNNRIREAWEAERKYMEANRERVEEVYKEERFIMEEERVEWESEKSSMLEEIKRLKSQVSGLQHDKARLESQVQQQQKGRPKTDTGLADPGSRANGGDGSTDVSASSPSYPALVAANDPRAPMAAANGTRGIELPTTASAAFSKPHIFSPPQLFSPGGTRLSPSMQPEASPFIPIDPTMHPVTSPPIDFLGSPKDEEVPIIDIQTIHPELDGIAVRAPAIQKETFTDSETENSKSSSRDHSPSGDRPDLQRRSSSKDHTLQVLAAPEPARLVMHAGHTPNHSLSQFPTAAATETGTAAEQSSSPTPTSGEPTTAAIPTTDETGDNKANKGKSTVRIEDNPAFELEAIDEDVAIAEPIPILEAPEDPELKGPLMVRNIPAHDEIFFRRLSEKLEDVSRGNDRVPVCMQPELDESGPSGAAKENLLVGSDGATDGLSSLEQRPKEDAAEIPLKLKKTTNFGAPLGTMF